MCIGKGRQYSLRVCLTLASCCIRVHAGISGGCDYIKASFDVFAACAMNSITRTR